jgi:four helix bundle protein
MEPSFKKLKVWQRAKDLAVYIYRLTDCGDISRDYSLRDQMRRAAVSMASNIAEGDERETNKESVRFFYVARASSAELLTQTLIANEVGYIDADDLKHVEAETVGISSMLYKLIGARCDAPNKPPLTFNR